jgi:bifunctional ADP-heptose synthase (sugar kinase/adenylyltransferase)
MARPKVVILGDIMLDRYFEIDRTKQSPEHDGLCLINPILKDENPGGAGNVATCLAKMGIPTMIIGAVGSTNLHRMLDWIPNLTNITFVVPNLECRKDRYLHEGVTHTRIDTDPIAEDFRIWDPMILEIINNLPKSCEVLITSDYNKGTLSESILQALKGRFQTWIADPKKTFYDAYKSEEIIIKPNSAEALDMTSTDDTSDAIAKLAEWTPGRIVVTDSKNPILYTDKDSTKEMVIPQYEPNTVVGAGDVMTAVLAAGAIKGWDLNKSLEAGVLACKHTLSLDPGSTLDRKAWNHIVTEVTDD